MQKKAIILLSGGLDSTTTLAIAKEQGFACYALTFDYGQKHIVENERAIIIAKHFNVIEHKFFTIQLDDIKGSALTDPDHPVPDYHPGVIMPDTYVPARNTLMLSYALSWAEVLGAYDIFYGAHLFDYSNYPDCRPEYIEAFEKLAVLATKAGTEGKTFKVHTPLLYMSKAEIIREGLKHGIDYRITVSCYRANKLGQACGTCDSCTYRKKGFHEAGIEDMTVYA